MWWALPWVYMSSKEIIKKLKDDGAPFEKYPEPYRAGFLEGYERGYDDGHRDGWEDGQEEMQELED